MNAADRLREQLAAAQPYGYTYDGITVWDMGDDGCCYFTLGHVDLAAFGAAIDAYLTDVLGPWERPAGWTGPAGVAKTAQHRTARIIPPGPGADDQREFPFGDFSIDLTGPGDVEVTFWDGWGRS